MKNFDKIKNDLNEKYINFLIESQIPWYKKFIRWFKNLVG